MPITAGILDICTGAWGGYYGFDYCLYGEGTFEGRFLFFGGWIILLGVAAIVGGIFALTRRYWALSVIGALAGFIMSFPFILSHKFFIVILALIAIGLTVFSRKQLIAFPIPRRFYSILSIPTLRPLASAAYRAVLPPPTPKE